MSKIIKVTQEYIEEIKKEFADALSSGKFPDGKVTFTKTIGLVNRNATVFFTEIAWLKMQTLISEFGSEVAWHGIARRGDDPTKDEYIISDILVYPQEVTGATVTTDQNKYQMWLMSHEDEVFNNIRFQGHSHVNMGTTPSSVDKNLYENILGQLSDDMFYIFMIWNKRGEKTILLYDMMKNVLFETSDCKVEVLDDGTGIEKWLREVKSVVTTKQTMYTPAYGGSYYGTSYQTPKTQTQTSSKKDAEQTKTQTATGKKKGKRVKKNETKTFSGTANDFYYGYPYGRDY